MYRCNERRNVTRSCYFAAEVGQFVPNRPVEEKHPSLERLLLSHYVSSDVLQYLIEQRTCSVILKIFPGQNRPFRSDSVSDFLKLFVSRNLENVLKL